MCYILVVIFSVKRLLILKTYGYWIRHFESWFFDLRFVISGPESLHMANLTEFRREIKCVTQRVKWQYRWTNSQLQFSISVRWAIISTIIARAIVSIHADYQIRDLCLLMRTINISLLDQLAFRHLYKLGICREFRFQAFGYACGICVVWSNAFSDWEFAKRQAGSPNTWKPSCEISWSLRPLGRILSRAAVQVCVDPTRPVSQVATLITGNRRVTILSR